MSKIKEFKKTFQAICKKNTLVIIMIVFLCPILGLSYANFVINTDDYRASEMYIGKLLYSVKIDDMPTNKINVFANSETEVVVEVTSLNEVMTNYKLVYESNPNIKIIYASDENEITNGSITSSKKSSLLITNSGESDIEVSFYVIGGYYNNDVSDITVDTKYTEIIDPYRKYSSTINYYVNGVLQPSLNISLIYRMESYSCDNNETLTYYPYTNKIDIYPYLGNTSCNVNLKYKENNPVYSYSCANGSYGMEPYNYKYTGDCEVVEEDIDNWKIKFLTNGTFSTSVDMPLDILVVSSGYNDTIDFNKYKPNDKDTSNIQYNNVVIDPNEEYVVNISPGGQESKTYFGSESTYFANGTKEGNGIVIIRNKR